MIFREKVWDERVCDLKASSLAAELDTSPLVTSILLGRGYKDVESMREFLRGGPKLFHDPFLMKDMAKAVERIEQALANNERITVYGDYDVDGITATSLLYIYLKRRGANVETYIPQRKSEGYGLNDEALRTIADAGTRLVITVDCGISGVREVENAPLSLDIIITDHHNVPPELPPACAIVNPKQADCNYPFKELSGVGVAFKLCQALEKHFSNSDELWVDLTELVALGTVADIVPLLKENRELVRRGLKAMENTQLVGMQALKRAAGCMGAITSEQIGFGLAPRLNAVGRLEHAKSAVELLVTEDEQEAERIANILNRENEERKEIGRKIMADAEAQLAQEKSIDTAIVLAQEDWHAGVIGIVASRLVEKYHLPTILLSLKDGVAKGSCRSIPALNLYEAIEAEKDLLTQFGGHHQAAGLTLPEEKVEEFRTRFKAFVKAKLKPEDYIPHQVVDCVVGCGGAITEKDLQDLELLEPCGACNNSPVFAFKHVPITNQRAIGCDKTHLQFLVRKSDYAYNCVMWNQASMLPFLFDNMLADIAFQPKLHTFRGETNVQLHILSIKQNITVGDFRMSFVSKEVLLESILRNEPSLVTLDTTELFKLEAQDNALVEQIKQSKAVALLAMPKVALRLLVKDLAGLGVKTVYLLYKAMDVEQALHDLERDYPNRAMFTEAYKAMMTLLKEKSSVSIEEAFTAYPEWLSKNSLQVMQELDFITISDELITKSVITKHELSDSPHYVRIQDERAQLEKNIRENATITQYDLLRYKQKK